MSTITGTIAENKAISGEMSANSKYATRGVIIDNGKVFVQDGENKIKLVTDNYTTYGVSIDLTNSNPETSVTYTDDAVGMVAGSDDWYNQPIFNKIKPCLFKDGQVVGYLNPNNFAQFEDGTEADITTGKAGDVMIEIPKIGYKLSTNNNNATVQITNELNKEGFSYLAHTRETEGDRDKLYVSAFLGYKDENNKLRSLSGKAPTIGNKRTEFRAYAQANGDGYDQLSFYPLTLLQCLYLIMFKHLNSQQALGMGYSIYVKNDMVWYPEAGCQLNTGATIDKGMNYGTTNEREQMKFLGMEDFWGNCAIYIEGIRSTSNGSAGKMYTETDNWDKAYEECLDCGLITVGTSVHAYATRISPNNKQGFLFKALDDSGSETTYYGDYVEVVDGVTVGIFGWGLGMGGQKSYNGCFALNLMNTNNEESLYGASGLPQITRGYNMGSRLMYL